jgi:lipopolysaccharide transport system ATP-binding protein
MIWALRDVSFEVKQGEVIGIIGRNGAGKSTLLKILSRITEPMEGAVRLQGRVASLLEVGTGFHPELTGRENIYLNGAILGMKKKDIDRQFDEIVDFAGVTKFIDTPVKHYSSGMYVRLAFSVAAHLDPEILLVDEVLAVGDAEFQRKCQGKIQDVTRQGRTILFVSHNMAAIRTLCTRTLLLDQGEIGYDGDTQVAITKYLDCQSAQGASVKEDELNKRQQCWLPQGVKYFSCHEIALQDVQGQQKNMFSSDEEIQLLIVVQCLEQVPNLEIVLELVDQDHTTLLRSEFLDDPVAKQYYFLEPGKYQLICTLPKDSFGERRFYVSVHFICHNVQHLTFKQILSFEVEFCGFNKNLSVHSKQAYFRPRLRWQIEGLPDKSALMCDDKVL